MMKEIFQGTNFCTTSGLLTATGAATTYDTTVTINYVLNGKIATKTAITSGVTPLLDSVTGLAFLTLNANKGCVLVWSLSAGGVVKVAQSEIKDLDASGAFVSAPQFPTLPDTHAPFAYQVLKAGATASAITIGTSNWNATGFTNVIVNVAVLPDRPQVS